MVSRVYCTCTIPVVIKLGDGRRICFECGEGVDPQKVPPPVEKSRIIADEETLRGACKMIKQHYRMIYEIRQMFGIQE